MKKIVSFTILLSLLAGSPLATAQSPQASDPMFVLLDVVVYRPVGVVATAVGTTVFAGISPLLALASIPKPHDAFQKTANILVLAPAAYTFLRPVGDKGFPYDEPVDRHLTGSPDVNTTLVVPSPKVTPPAPSVTPVEVKPAIINGL